MNLNKDEKQKLKTSLVFLFWYYTFKHKVFVLGYIIRFCAKLVWRGIFHDLSKFTLYEGYIYGQSLPEFKKAKYGTEEYGRVLEMAQPAIEHHYALNRHHPQHFAEGYRSMNLLDFTEMYFDWKAASNKSSGTGSLEKSLLINAKRFKMSPDIVGIMMNSTDL